VWARSLSRVITGEALPLPFDAKWSCINLRCPSQQQQQQQQHETRSDKSIVSKAPV
jgi:hypothetical protein